ncbi:short-chain dehydrogenase/reductase [Streptomyces sp. NPDC001920]
MSTTIDPVDDGSEQVSDLADSARADFCRRIGMTGLLTARTAS